MGEGPIVVIVMGVSGSGKSSLGRLLASRTNGVFVEGDDYHPAANVAKMSTGIALGDADRWPWLDGVAGALSGLLPGAGVIVCACSALKRRYRDRLRSALNYPICFVCLTAGREALAHRVANRPGHYWPASLLDSQLEILEVPQSDEEAIVLSSELQPDELVTRVLDHLGGRDAKR
jgi:gluconokinase